MKKNTILAIAIVFGMACNTENPQHTQALNSYKTYVDSILQISNTNKFFGDTMFVEFPIDPNDPTKTEVKTIISHPINGDSNIYHYSPNNFMLKEFHQKKTEAIGAELIGANNKVMEQFKSYQLAIDTLIRLQE